MKMAETKTKLQPAKWQVTATTISCDLVDDFVTIMVDKDWSVKCAWYNKYKAKALEDKTHKFDKEIRQKIEKCQGPTCYYMTDYRDKLIKEEPGEK
jgi:hypothetical protein